MLIQVISSTTREGRFSERVASWVTGQLAGRDDFVVEQVDLRDYPLPFFDGVAPARAPREYAMDWTFVEWRRKPMSFVGWGQVGGARAIEQLRLVAVEFEMAPLRHAVHILPDITMAARQADDPGDVSMFAPLEPRLKLLADDLVWWAGVLAAR